MYSREYGENNLTLMEKAHTTKVVGVHIKKIVRDHVHVYGIVDAPVHIQARSTATVCLENHSLLLIQKKNKIKKGSRELKHIKTHHGTPFEQIDLL